MASNLVIVELEEHFQSGSFDHGNPIVLESSELPLRTNLTLISSNFYSSPIPNGLLLENFDVDFKVLIGW